MSISEDLDGFATERKKEIEEMLLIAERNAKATLVALLGDDVEAILAIRLDADTGKFYGVEAPAEIVATLRSAGLLQEEERNDSPSKDGER